MTFLVTSGTVDAVSAFVCAIVGVPVFRFVLRESRRRAQASNGGRRTTTA